LRWWNSNSDANTNPNTNSYANSDTDTNACAGAERSVEPGRECSFRDSDQLDLDGQCE